MCSDGNPCLLQGLDRVLVYKLQDEFWLKLNKNKLTVVLPILINRFTIYGVEI